MPRKSKNKTQRDATPDLDVYEHGQGPWGMTPAFTPDPERSSTMSSSMLRGGAPSRIADRTAKYMIEVNLDSPSVLPQLTLALDKPSPSYAATVEKGRLLELRYKTKVKRQLLSGGMRRVTMGDVKERVYQDMSVNPIVAKLELAERMMYLALDQYEQVQDDIEDMPAEGDLAMIKLMKDSGRMVDIMSQIESISEDIISTDETSSCGSGKSLDKSHRRWGDRDEENLHSSNEVHGSLVTKKPDQSFGLVW